MRLLRKAQSATHPVSPSGERDVLAALLLRAGRGDQSAFGELYDHVSSLVYGIVLRVVRDPAQAEEVAQEVFVEIWRIAPRYDEQKGSVKGWAATVAHRRAIDRVRAEQANRDRLEQEAVRGATERVAHEDVADAVAERDGTAFDRARVQKALRCLTDTQREAVELAYFGGHTYREVAALLDQPEGTVKSRIRDGMIRLRDELGASS